MTDKGNPTVEDLLDRPREHLVERMEALGFTGLYATGPRTDQCACGIDGKVVGDHTCRLLPCCLPDDDIPPAGILQCRAGYLTPCDCDDHRHPFHVVASEDDIKVSPGMPIWEWAEEQGEKAAELDRLDVEQGVQAPVEEDEYGTICIAIACASCDVRFWTPKHGNEMFCAKCRVPAERDGEPPRSTPRYTELAECATCGKDFPTRPEEGHLLCPDCMPEGGA